MEEPLEDSVNEQDPKNYKFIQLQKEVDVVRLTLNRPPYNVMNISMLEEIGHALDAIDMMQDTKIVLFEGSDKSFSGGLDIASIAFSGV
jgi:enoyl-CoA hydratase/carnithine racemase